MENNENINSISEKEQKTIAKYTFQVLDRYQNSDKSLSLKDFFDLLLSERNDIKDKESVDVELQEAFNAIDLVNEYQSNLLNSRKKGKSKSGWLKETISSILKDNDPKEIGKIVFDLQSQLTDNNNAYLQLIQESMSPWIENLYSSKSEIENINSAVEDNKISSISLFKEAEIYNEYSSNSELFMPMAMMEYEGINKQLINSKILGDLQNNSLVASIHIAQQFHSVSKVFELDSLDIVDVSKNFFESELDIEDTTLSKLSAMSLILAKHEAHIAILERLSAFEIGIIADSGLFMAKVLYQLAQGKIRHDQAIEKLADKVISGAGAIFQQTIQLKTKIVGIQAGAMIGSVFGPIGIVVGAASGYVTGKAAGNGISEGIKSGVKKLSKIAQIALSNTIRSISEIKESIKNKVSGVRSLLKRFF